MKNSKYRNWHKRWSLTDKKDLSQAFPVSVSGYPEGVHIEFQNGEGKKIRFELTKEDSASFLMQVDRVVNPQEYKK